MRGTRAVTRLVLVLGALGGTIVLGGADEPAGGGCGPGGTTETTVVTTDDEGGANANEQVAGNNDRGGADLSTVVDAWDGDQTLLREAAVDPEGTYFLSSYRGQLVHWRLDSAAFEATCLAAGGMLGSELEHAVRVVPGVDSPSRVGFGAASRRFYVTSSTSALVRAYDPDTLQVLWSTSVDVVGDGGRLYVGSDDRTLVVAGPETAVVLDAASGVPMFDWMRGTLVDVDYAPDGGRVLLTLQETWEWGVPSTRVVVLDVRRGDTSTIEVPNCAANLVVAPGGRRAFLAPTRCGFDTTQIEIDQRPSAIDAPWAYDPVSVIDLEAGTLLRNLPGFGPVALTEDGSLGLAFVNTDHLAEELFDDPAQIPSAAQATYHAMIFDARTLFFDTVPIGDVLPRYALLPDGRVALLDGDRTTTCTQDGVEYLCGNDAWDNRTRVLDLASRRVDELEGPLVSLNQYAVTADAQRVFLLQNQDLYSISLARLTVSRVRTDYRVQTLNLTPDGARLLLLDTDGVLHVFDARAARSLYHVTPPGE